MTAGGSGLPHEQAMTPMWCTHNHLTWPNGLWWPLVAVIGASHIKGCPDDFAVHLLARPAAKGGGSLIITCPASEM